MNGAQHGVEVVPSLLLRGSLLLAALV